MAKTSGFFSPTVPGLRKTIPPSIGMCRSVYFSGEGISKGVFCSSTIEGSEKLGSGVSPSESRVPSSAIAIESLLFKAILIWGSFVFHLIEYCCKESLTALAVEAAQKALEMAEVDPDDVDLVLLCTSTPEDLFGSAPQIQKALGCKGNPLAYDITAACSGFLLGLVSAACYIRGGGFNNVLVIGADALSRYVDWTDRGTCILFGDAAGAVVVQSAHRWKGCEILHSLCFVFQVMTASAFLFSHFFGLLKIQKSVARDLWKMMLYGFSEEDGLFGFDLHSDGDGQRHLNASTMNENEADLGLGSNGSVLGFPPKRSSYSCIQMNGKEVFRFVVRYVPQSIESALEKAGLSGSSIDWLLLHQANRRIIDAVATRLEVPPERVISNLANYGNTSAASIPLALDEAVRSGKVKSGHMIAAAGFGAGLTWGSAIVRWG
ncbi:hypothetical protein TEA_006373 [Camellia sinensis var. sinensis]|uniref:Beta-ketoacyl-[acyl-carrier-protein] synthase III C-terminal domain-containing protein n=1 Tax=Camellia sinensis var. sinensis TaxID=542762 RepID=A0A4S4E182_CAMSN|nr:hypothetical protein TEA_006373 [Camellia sinensis var. sinensis]